MVAFGKKCGKNRKKCSFASLLSLLQSNKSPNMPRDWYNLAAVSEQLAMLMSSKQMYDF